MAIVEMKKVIIASFKDEAGELLEAIQQAGIMQVLDAERAVISKDRPELQGPTEPPRQIEERLQKLEQAVDFLNGYAEKKTGLAAALAPKAVIDRNHFSKIVSSAEAIGSLEACRQLQQKIHSITTEIENLTGQIQHIEPWRNLATPLEEIEQLKKTIVLAGFLSVKSSIEAEKKLAEFAIVERIGRHNNSVACIVACFRENAQEVHKILRGLEFEAVSFASLKGTSSELIREYQRKLAGEQKALAEAEKETRELSKGIIDLQILADYYRNLLSRNKTQLTSPQTEQTVILEGWVKREDFERLKEIVGQFSASSINEMSIGKDEDIPVEIENNRVVRPFETITRLYGMPHRTSVDPTVFLAPFFAIFFGLCISDVGYGLMLAPVLWWLSRKIQAGKRVVTLFLICSFTTILGGIITGSWFADTFTALTPHQSKLYLSLNSIREKLMLFDPMKSPLTFIALALALGYIQIMFGLCIAFINNLLKKKNIDAVCDQLVWLLFLNNFIVLGMAKGKIIPAYFGTISIAIAIACALIILLFTVRQGRWSGRVGMGLFHLFSTVFYVGDILSYVRIMALGMVSVGFGMAINVIVKILMNVPHIGYILGGILFVAGHTTNLAISLLGAFVHSLRLQFVEFFPKFFIGGGMDFQPLHKEYKHIALKE